MSKIVGKFTDLEKHDIDNGVTMKKTSFYSNQKLVHLGSNE